MTEIRLLDELHANTRRTRITYRAEADGQAIAIKCYLRPAFGLFHWIRAQHRGKKIRQVGGPVPAIVYSGWVAEKRCFGFATAFLHDYRPLREALREEPERARQITILQHLGATMADLHSRGILQTDGNLTNFLLGPDNDIKMVDEDDVRVFADILPSRHAAANLANVAARIHDEEMLSELMHAYLNEAPAEILRDWNDQAFHAHVEKDKSMLTDKRTKRKINPVRMFD